MKYERRPALVDAVLVNSLVNVEEALRTCPYVSGVVEVYYHLSDDPDTWYVGIEGDGIVYRVEFGDYFIWDDRGVEVLHAHAFETKYRLPAG